MRTKRLVVVLAVVAVVGSGVAFAASNDSTLRAVGLKGDTSKAATIKTPKGSVNTQATTDWTNSAKSQLDKAGVRVTLDGKDYDNTTVASAMFGRAQQKAQLAAIAEFKKHPDRPPEPDLMTFMPPPDISQARQAVASVVLDGLLFNEAVAAHRDVPVADAKAAVQQSVDVLKSSPELRSAVQTAAGQTPEQAMSSPRSVEVMRQHMTVVNERSSVLEAAAKVNPAVAAAASPSGDSVSPDAVQAQQTERDKALADWMVLALKRHSVAIAGLGTFGPGELATALTTQ